MLQLLRRIAYIARECSLLLYYYSFIILLLRHIRQHTSTQAHKYKKAKIHLKYDLKYKKDINTNIKAHRRDLSVCVSVCLLGTRVSCAKTFHRDTVWGEDA